MSKNFILILGILALWLLVIRKGKYTGTDDKKTGTTTHESESGKTHGGSSGTFGNIQTGGQGFLL